MVCPTQQQGRSQTRGARSHARHAGSRVGGTAGIAGLAACSTAGESLWEDKILRCCSTVEPAPPRTRLSATTRVTVKP